MPSALGSGDISWAFMSKLYRVALAAGFACALAACSQVDEVPPSMRPLTKDAMHLLGSKGMSVNSQMFVRIFKEDSELEVWKARDDGHFYHYKTYPICTWSGDLGPKIQTGDKQSPEGYYQVRESQLNPNSKYHLSFNLGFPNAFDRAFGRTGDALMVHGNCKSAGCYAMTDALIEEIYALMREAFAGGQEVVQVHAYPFRMTPENMKRNRKHPAYAFWRQMKQGYDYFELTKQPPPVAVCNRKYLVNAQFVNAAAVSPTAPCPRFVRPTPEVFATSPRERTLVEARVVVAGVKMRNLAMESSRAGYQAPFGLTLAPSGAIAESASGPLSVEELLEQN